MGWQLGRWVGGVGRGESEKEAWVGGVGGGGVEERRIWEEEIEWALKKIHPLTGNRDQGKCSCQKKDKIKDYRDLALCVPYYLMEAREWGLGR